MKDILFCLTIAVVVAVDLSSFKKFKVAFDPKCREYFLFNGTDNYAYLHQRNGKFELWLTQNSTNYAIYTVKNSSTLLFEWNASSVIINHQILTPVIREGFITFPMKFHSEQYLCDVIGLIGGNTNVFCTVEIPSKCEPLTYKCRPQANWILICIAISLVVLAGSFLLYIKNGSVQSLLRFTISRIIQWRGQIFSRSEEDTSESHEEVSFTNSA